jgi:AraC family transcriptional regulator
MRPSTFMAVCLVVLLLTTGLTASAGVTKTDKAPPEAPVKIHLKYTEPRTVATMRHQGSFEHIPEVIGNIMTEITKGDHLVAGPIMIVYYNDPAEVPEEEYLWEIWIPVVRPGTFGRVENDVMGFRYLDTMFAAYIYHVGPYETVGESYDMLFEWAARNEYDMAGPPVEVYWSDPEQTTGEKLVTEIWLPVLEKKIPGGVVR